MTTPNDLKPDAASPLSAKTPRTVSPGAIPFRSLVREIRSSARFLYNHNPFYVISAMLMLTGIRQTLEPSGEALAPWIPMGMLAGYALLLAVTAYLIVRFGKVWDDARTILLTIVIQFLALSMMFDELLVTRPTLGEPLLLVGLGFSLLVSKGVLHALGIRLRAGYETPYALLLSTFFLYPCWLARLLQRGPNLWTMPWAILGFGALCGVLTWSLIPAIRQGPEYVAENGTPWRWPLFPWSLFVLLAIAVPIRIHLLSLSFNPEDDRFVGFGAYFLIPFLGPALLVALELALVSKQRRAMWIVLLLPFGLIALAIPCHDADLRYTGFVYEFIEHVDSPVHLTLLGLVAFYGYALLREVRLAELGMSATLLALSLVGPATLDWRTTVPLQLAPLVALVALWTWFAIREGSSGRWLGASAFGMLLLTGALRETWFLADHGAVPIHLGLLATWVIGVSFSDPIARALRNLVAVAIAVLGLGLVTGARTDHGEWSAALSVGYMTLLTAVPMVYWYATSNRWHLVAGISNGSGGGAWLLLRVYRSLVSLPVGFTALACGAGAFLVAAIISAAKAGALSAWRKRPEESSPPVG